MKLNHNRHHQHVKLLQMRDVHAPRPPPGTFSFLQTGEQQDTHWWSSTCSLEFLLPNSATTLQIDTQSLEQFVAQTVLFRATYTRLRDRPSAAGQNRVSIPLVFLPDTESNVLNSTHIVMFGNVLEWPKEMYRDIISKRLTVCTAVFAELDDASVLRHEAISDTPMTNISMGSNDDDQEEKESAISSNSLVDHVVHSSQKGPRQTMEDFYIKDTFEEYKVFAVFDGHSGTAAAEICAELFSPLLARFLAKTLDVEHSLIRTLAEIENHVLERFMPKPEDVGESEAEAMQRLSGSCVCACVCTKDKLYVSNLGDSRAVLSTRTGKPVLLTPCDHNTSNPDEVARVLREGGRLVDNRITGLVDGRYSSLLVSRSIGDLDFVEETRVFTKAKGVSSQPDVFTRELDREQDEFVILACDGLWEVVTQDQACMLVRQSLRKTKGNLQEACDQLVCRAIKNNTTDNVTVLIAALPAMELIWTAPQPPNAEEEQSERERPRFNFGGLKKIIL